MHGIVMVDLNDIMLMPLPTSVQREDHAQLDRLCKALMETMFIRRVHIMDWMRGINLQPNHWKTLLNWMESDEKNPLSDILSRYSENCSGTKDFAEKTGKNNLPKISTTSTSANDRCNSSNDEKDPLAEDETDSPNDIAFVDCGSTPNNTLLPDFPEVNSPEDSGSDRTIGRAKSLWRSFSQQYDILKDKPRNISPNADGIGLVKTAASSSPAVTINRNTPRLVTIRTCKNLSLSTIIKHLPMETHNTKNLVLVPEDAEAQNGSAKLPDLRQATIPQPSSSCQVKSNESSAQDDKCEKKEKINVTLNCPSSVLDKNSKTVPQVPMLQNFPEQASLQGRIVFQNGRKYIIRHVPKTKSHSILQDSIVKKLRNPPPLIAPISGAKIPILPKPLPITTISNILTQSQAKAEKPSSTKRFPKRAKALAKFMYPTEFPLTTVNENSTPQNAKSRLSKMQQALLTKCRETLMSDLRRVSEDRLESYIRHLKGINERYSRMMNLPIDSVLMNKTTINSFENMRKLPRTDQLPCSIDELPIQDMFENDLREWETRMTVNEKNQRCETCRKSVKPAYYIVGISAPPINEANYCQCYNNFCHICNVNQGNLLQLRRHLEWHQGEKPFTCPSCSLVFLSSSELEIHVWTSCFHPMSGYIYGCGVCEIEGILDMESIAQHFLLLHTRRKIICADCKMEFPGNATSEDYAKHHSEHHSDRPEMSVPKRLLVCSLKQCIVRPELFRAHLSEHIGVLRWIYYKCPFCTTVAQNSGRNKAQIRQHLIECHLDRMHEIVSKETLSRVINGIKMTVTSGSGGIQDSGTGEICQVSNADTSGPKILDARTITPATFEFGSDSPEETPVEQHDESKLPRILEVRSEAVDEFGSEETGANDLRPEILPVKYIADSSPGSPGIPKEPSKVTGESLTEPPTTITLQLDSSLVREQLECEDSSNSHDEISVISIHSTKGDEFKLENSFSPSESYDENGDCDAKDFINDSHFQRLLTSEQNSAQKPWRIALNSPADVGTKPVVYNCHLCGQMINTSWSVIKNHFDTKHSSDYEIFAVSPNIPRVSMDFLEDSSSNHQNSIDANNKRRKMEIVPAIGPKRRRRWGPKKHIERAGSPSFGICVKPEPVQQIEGTFRCKKCDQAFEDREMLRNHIAAQHRIKGQYLICLECGENFVVVPSLQMHLKALHGIQDPITYLTKNTAYAPETLDDTEEDEKAMESNQCYVCMAVFEDKPALDKHMRVHGMAFLKRRRFEALKAWKSSPKTHTDNNSETFDDKSINSSNEFSTSIKSKLESTDDNKSRSPTLQNKSSREQIENIRSKIMEIDRIESSPTTT